MTNPNIYTFKKEEGRAEYLVGESIDINVGGVGRVIPSMLIFKDKSNYTVCTDYFESMCKICSKTECIFNTSHRKEG